MAFLNNDLISAGKQHRETLHLITYKLSDKIIKNLNVYILFSFH